MDDALKQAAAPQRYRHFKGGVYEFVCTAALESDPSVTMVVYRAADGSIWTRPSAVFFEQVEHGGVSMPRFTAMEPAPPASASTD
jgi:hypothetical protein